MEPKFKLHKSNSSSEESSNQIIEIPLIIDQRNIFKISVEHLSITTLEKKFINFLFRDLDYYNDCETNLFISWVDIRRAQTLFQVLRTDKNFMGTEEKKNQFSISRFNNKDSLDSGCYSVGKFRIMSRKRSKLPNKEITQEEFFDNIIEYGEVLKLDYNNGHCETFGHVATRRHWLKPDSYHTHPITNSCEYDLFKV